jgi:hypothetical protein
MKRRSCLGLFKRLAPSKEKKWAGWVQKLKGIGIDSPADIEDVTPEDKGGLDDVPLKRVLETYSNEMDDLNAGEGGAQEEDSSSEHTLGVAGERGVLGRYLGAGGQGTMGKFRRREVRLDADAHLLNITGGHPTRTETINLHGASLDRCPGAPSTNLNPTQRRSGLRKGTNAPAVGHKFTFLIRHGDGKELLLQANNREIFCTWTGAIANAGAAFTDPGEFDTTLHDPQFTLVPVGGSGVGKSTFVNFITGSMWIMESNGFAIGYEDALFKTSSGVESMTTADDMKVVRRQWCGRGDVFNIMDTPGAFDVRRRGSSSSRHGKHWCCR